MAIDLCCCVKFKHIYLFQLPGMPYNPIWGSMNVYMKGEAMQASVE